MQEDIDRRTVALAVKASKLTAQGLAKALAAALRKIQQNQRQPPQGKQSAKQLRGQCSPKNIPLDGETRLWDRVARKYNVDYAFEKIGPKKHLLLFKAGQADDITLAFSEYTKRVMAKAKDKRPPIREQLAQSAEQARSRPRQHERVKEAARGDR